MAPEEIAKEGVIISPHLLEDHYTVTLEVKLAFHPETSPIYVCAFETLGNEVARQTPFMVNRMLVDAVFAVTIQACFAVPWPVLSS